MEIQHNPLEGGDLHATQVSEQEQLVHATEQDQVIAEPYAQPPAHSGEFPIQPPERQNHLTDDHLIHYHITEALRENRPIDHATARCIASQLHGGQASALYALTSSGAIADDLRRELDSWRRDETPVEVEPWLDALDEYLGSRDDEGPIDGWHNLWPVQPERGDDEPDGGEEERPPYGALASAIGGAAVNVQAGNQGEDEQSVEQQHKTEHPVEQQEAERPVESPAVHRIREGMAAAQADGRQIDDRTACDIARVFKATPDGPLAVFAGCGAILNENDELFQELYARWDEHTEEQQAWAEALRSYCLGRGSEAPVAYWGEDNESRDVARGDRPEIWVGSLSDYTNGVLHGMWVAADQEPEEIHEQIAWILRTSPTARRYGEVAEEWGIFDHSGFCGYNVSEYANLDTASLVAKGIAEHGEAYAEWVEYVGDTAEELLDAESFHDHYEGTFDSLEEYVEHILEETGFYSELDRALEIIPEDLRRHIQVDVEGIAEEWGQGLYVAETRDGKVHVFDGRC